MAVQLKTLKGAPPSFPITVTTKDLSGQDVEITFTAIGRTLRDWHPIYMKRLADEANANIAAQEKAKAAVGAADDERADNEPAEPVVYNADEVSANIEDALKRGAALVREVATGWALDVEFADAAITDLIAQYPGVQQVLHQQYHQTIMGHRVKNS